MERPCDVCGGIYEAKRPSSKFCSATCRQRAARGAPTNHVAPVTPLPTSTETGPVETEAKRHLSGLGRESTVLGQAALALARRLDAGRDTGTAMASLAKQLQATLDSATEGVTTAADPLDELRARRDAKRNVG